MNSSKAVIPVHSDRLNHLALALSREGRTLLNLDVNIEQLFYTDEGVEAELMF